MTGVRSLRNPRPDPTPSGPAPALPPQAPLPWPPKSLAAPATNGPATGAGSAEAQGYAAGLHHNKDKKQPPGAPWRRWGAGVGCPSHLAGSQGPGSSFPLSFGARDRPARGLTARSSVRTEHAAIAWGPPLSPPRLPATRSTLQEAGIAPALKGPSRTPPLGPGTPPSAQNLKPALPKSLARQHPRVHRRTLASSLTPGPAEPVSAAAMATRIRTPPPPVAGPASATG